MQRFNEDLHAVGISVQPQMRVRGAGRPGYIGLVTTSFVGEFIVPLAQVVGTLGVGGILVAWLQGRAGRKVRLKVGDIEAEARTAEEVEKLLLLAKQFRQDQSPKGVTPEKAGDDS